jgi:hypothetical protein
VELSTFSSTQGDPVLIAITLLLAAAGKLLAHPQMQATAAHFGIPWSRYGLIGVAASGRCREQAWAT